MKTKIKIGIIAVLLMALGACTWQAIVSAIPPAHADALTSDKYDGDCTGQETAGRCADKCPAATDQGVWYQIGNDKETGAAICKMGYYHACPYADSVSADDPLCTKLQPQTTTDTQATTNTTAPQEDAAVPACMGK